MGPKSNQKPSKAKTFSKDGEIEATLAALSKHIEKSKNRASKIHLPSSANDIDNILGTIRASGKAIPLTPVVTIITQLEEYDDDICSRLDASVFCFIVEVALRIQCKEAERGLYLLATSLFRSPRPSGPDKELTLRKETIGSQCLLSLLKFFLDSKVDIGMRRSAGFLCIQLIAGCEKNRMVLELAKEDTRRCIGAKIFEEPNEILKILCAYMIRIMSNEGTPLDTLFPVGCDESLYAKFPKASQGNAGWGAQFQMYLDKLPDMVENMPEQTGNLFFASAVQVATPKRQVGASHHNSVLFINGSHMSFLALAQEGHFNSTLDIPLSIIKTMTNTRDTASQVASQCVNLELLDDPKRRCYLDSRAAVLNNVWFSIWEESLDNIRDCVKGYNPEVRVLDGEPSTTGPSQNASQSQRNKTSYTNLEQSPENQSSIQSGGPDAGSLRSLASEEHFQKEGLTVLSESDDLPEASHLGMKPMEGSIAPLNPLEDLGRSDAVCQEDEEAPQNSIHDPLKVSSKNAQTKELDTPANVIPAIPRPNKVKPKAKKPIVRPSIGAIGKEVGSQSTETKLDASAVDVLKAKRNGQLRPAVPVAPALPLVPNPEYLNDVFELPIDDEELGPTKKSNKGAAKSKPKAPAKVTGRLGAARVDTKKRQSAIKPKPKAAQGSKGSIPTPANPSAKTRQAEPEPGAISDAISEYDIDQLQAQDADKPDVSDAVAKKADQVNDDDDLYNATPQKPALKPESNLVASKAKTLFTAGPNKTKDSGLDLASKLDGILEHLDSDSEKHSPQQAVLETSTVAENCTVQSKFEQGEKQRVSPAAGVSNNYEPDDEPETEEKIDQISSPGDASDGLSLTELDLRPVPSSVASRSNTTPSLVEDPSTEERKIARKPGPAVNLSKRETYPDKQASTGFSKKASKLILGRQSIGESDVATNETPEQPASDHEDGRIVTQEQKKRKVLEFRNVPSKRRRLDEDEVDVQQGQDEASNPVPEPYHHERKAGLAENPMQPDPISLESRPMPDRNLARVSEPSIVSDTPAHESSNIRKDVDRKPRVIGFSSRGPRNQGIGSVNKIQAEEGVEIDIEHATQIAHLNDRKRKRVKATLKDPMNAHKKRYSSPVSATMAGVFTEDNLIDVDQAAIESSPPASEVQHKPVRHQKGLPRQFSASSSQPLRINRNGSPIAGESPVDHIKLLKERLAGPAPSEGAQAPKPAVHDPSTPLRERRHSQIFGPTIILGKKLKARPASPGEAESRYVPHEKTNYGAYNAIDSKKVIEPKRNLADPFIERARKSNRFTERLHSSASKENAQTAMRHEIQGNNRELPRTLVQGSPTARVRKVATHRYQVDQIPVEFPRGAVERNSTQQTRYENSLTSGTSLDSVSSESARTPLQEVITPNERWNVVLRPHYDTLGQAVHRIADEVIIRLSSEEDKMGLLVTQYQENGTKIIDNLAKKRESERGVIFRKLDDQKSEIAKTYSEARDEIMHSAQGLRDEATDQIEEEWRRKQDAIRKQIQLGQEAPRK